MKTGQNKKKLVLNKISIAQLDNDKARQVKGGFLLTDDDCESRTCKTLNRPECPTYPVCQIEKILNSNVAIAAFKINAELKCKNFQNIIV